MRITRVHPYLLLLWGGALFTSSAVAETVLFRGKVTMADGSPPGRNVSIQRVCPGLDHVIREASVFPKTGEYMVRMELDDFGHIGAQVGYTSVPCFLEASASGFVSSRLDLMDRRVVMNPQLPPIVLTPVAESLNFDAGRVPNLPRAAQAPWETAMRQLTARNWAAAEVPLRSVVKVSPQFAPGWIALGSNYSNLGNLEEASKALQRAIELDPNVLSTYRLLADVEIDLKDWKGAAATSRALIAADSKNQFIEAHLQNAVALYQLQAYDGALTRINEAIRLDKKGELPRAELVLGLIQEALHDYEAAALHLRNYIQQHPYARDVAIATERLANLGKAAVADLSVELTREDLRLAATAEAPVPGGLKAFAAIAHLPGTPSYQDFFLEYCRALTEGRLDNFNPTKESGDAIRAYIAGIPALEAMGDRRDDGTVVHLSTENDEQRRKSQIVLALLGWKLVPKGDSYTLEPGDQAIDGFRQWMLAALDVDELALRQAVEEKRSFEFRIPRDNARLVGGAAWGVVVKGGQNLNGGTIELFTKDLRFARVYRGLGAMENDSAAAVISAVGLANLITKYSGLMADFGDAVTLTKQLVTVPGGANALAAWTKLAGASPQTPAPFLRALFEKDQGRLLAFYSDLTHADAAHRQYFTQTVGRAEAYYNWYRESTFPTNTADRWQASLLQKLPIDASGKVAFPGGREAWSMAAESDDDVLLRRAPLEAITAMAVLEEKRGVPLSKGAAQLLARHYDAWRSLFPYFEKLPGLDTSDFQALADLGEEVAKAQASRQNLVMGDWHSLVQLMVMGTQAGTLDGSQGARFFRQACEGLRSANPTAGALQVLREMVGGGGDVDEALPRFLRLSGARLTAFENVKAAQKVPLIGTLSERPDALKTLAALSGAVYAAMLDPTWLLVAENPSLLDHHSFVPAGVLFAPSGLTISNKLPGSHFTGGFGQFQDVAKELNRRTVGELPMPAETEAVAVPTQAGGPSGTAAPPPPRDLVFRAGGRIVEVYATVTDSRGRYVDDLSAGQFAIRENGKPKSVFAFENHTSGVSVALVFDTTGSMASTLPSLKNAAMQLVQDLRPADSVAVYSFADTVTELQPFTSDKVAAKRAILKTHAAGITALYDALVRVNHDLSARAGKKVIIVFTDGSDNASLLTASIAVERAKARGIPIYTIAQGEAVAEKELVKELANISQLTGGTPFLIRKLSDISAVFEKVSEDLMHGYLLAFQPAPGDQQEWRTIQVVLNGNKGLLVRAREGFYVE